MYHQSPALAVLGPSVKFSVKGSDASLHGPYGLLAKATLMLRMGRELSFTTIT